MTKLAVRVDSSSEQFDQPASLLGAIGFSHEALHVEGFHSRGEGRGGQLGWRPSVDHGQPPNSSGGNFCQTKPISLVLSINRLETPSDKRFCSFVPPEGLRFSSVVGSVPTFYSSRGLAHCLNGGALGLAQRTGSREHVKARFRGCQLAN